MVIGFGVYGLTGMVGSYYLKYKYVIMNTASPELELEIQAHEIDESKKIYMVQLEGDMIEVPPGTDITF